MSRIFSGIQPTGDLQLGNYLGALKNWVMLQHDHDCIYCVVDLHAITMWQDPKLLAPNTREVTAGLIASGLDPDKNIIFNQSQVTQHAGLAWIFNCVSRLGWLNRMTQFKVNLRRHALPCVIESHSGKEWQGPRWCSSRPVYIPGAAISSLPFV